MNLPDNTAAKPFSRDKVENILPHVKFGDIFAFSGKTPFSKLITVATRSPISHTAIALVDENGTRCLQSTWDLHQNGVSIVELVRCIDEYDGDVWWLALDDVFRSKIDHGKFRKFVQSVQNRQFDWIGAMQSAEVILPTLGLDEKLKVIYKEDLSKLFCSELIVAALRESGAIFRINASETTPIDLCMFRIYTAKYVQLKSSADKIINGFNSINPENWGF